MQGEGPQWTVGDDKRVIQGLRACQRLQQLSEDLLSQKKADRTPGDSHEDCRRLQQLSAKAEGLSEAAKGSRRLFFWVGGINIMSSNVVSSIVLRLTNYR